MLLFLSFQHYRKNGKETSKRQSRKHGHDHTSPSQQHMVSTVPVSVQSSSVSTSSKHKQKVVSIYVTSVTMPATLRNLDGYIIPMLDMVMSLKTGGHSVRKRRWIHMT